MIIVVIIATLTPSSSSVCVYLKWWKVMHNAICQRLQCRGKQWFSVAGVRLCFWVEELCSTRRTRTLPLLPTINFTFKQVKETNLEKRKEKMMDCCLRFGRSASSSPLLAKRNRNSCCTLQLTIHSILIKASIIWIRINVTGRKYLLTVARVMRPNIFSWCAPRFVDSFQTFGAIRCQRRKKIR